MVSINDLKELMLYKKQFYLPIDMKNKKFGSAIILMTPNFQSSKLAMTAPYTVNRLYFESYYVEKSITGLIQNESVNILDGSDEYLVEAALSSSERKSIPDEDFGIPSQRRYPLNDKKHVLLAIKFFNHVESTYEQELARNIIKKIKSFNMANEVHVGEGNRFKKYWDKSGLATVNESAILLEETTLDGENEYFFDEVYSQASETLERKTSDKHVTISGFKSTVNQVLRVMKKYRIHPKDAFEKINRSMPNRVNIMITEDPNQQEEYTPDTLIIYSPSIVANRYKFKYEDYLKYSFQLFAIYTLKPKSGRAVPLHIMDTLAEPAAILLSGIRDNEIAENKDDKYIIENIYQHIIVTEGMEKLLDIIASNDTTSVIKYGLEFGRERVKNKVFREEVNLMEEELSILKEDGEVSTPVPEDPTPESLKQIQNLGTRLKRRIKQHSVYKLNKIMRDISRGNVGTETRGMNSIEQIQTDNLLTGAPTYKTEQLDMLTGGDYIRQGNHVFLFESSDKYDMALRKALFKDRFRTNKQVLDLYNNVKRELPFIKYAFTDVPRYKNRNLFIDTSYYNETFFRNMADLMPEDRANPLRIFKTYMELMERLLRDDKFNSYKVKTIFIPILDWQHGHSERMWMFKEDINPISVIYYFMKYSPATLKKIFGDRNVVFMGAKNYFKVNFSVTDFTANGMMAAKFINLIRRIQKLGYNSPADPDPEGELDISPSGIAMDIVDKIERSQNVTIDDVSGFEKLNKSTELFQNYEPMADGITDGPAAVKKVVADSPVSKVVSTVPATVTVGTATTKVYSSSNRGKKVEVPVTVQQVAVTKAMDQASTGVATNTTAVNSTSEKDKKDAIVDAIAKVANNADSVDDALDKLNQDDFKAMILALQTDSTDNVRVDRAQASAVVAAQEEFHKKQVAGQSVKEMLEKDVAKEELKKTSLPVASINEDWNNLTFMNFDKGYDPNVDIVKMLDSMQHWTFPIAVTNIDIHDNSTSEDVLDLWTIDCVDYKNTKFTLKVDIPKFINGSNFLKLRGNEKVLMIQSALLPIIKTGLDECQIIGTGGYNKIFVRLFGARRGQSTPAANNIIRAVNKCLKTNKVDIKVVGGDNGKVCAKYNLPIDYIDLAQVFDTVELGGVKLYFNQDNLRKEFEVDDTKGIPIGTIDIVDPDPKKPAVKQILYYTIEESKRSGTMSAFIGRQLCFQSDEFRMIYDNISTAGNRYTYSKASILDCTIPVVVVCGYLEGLIPTLKKAGIDYEFKQTLDKADRYDETKDYIAFSDGYLIYKVTYSSSLLLNGLKECDTESYSIKDVNNRRMYYEFLDNYGGGGLIRADGLENSYDCMLDPITKEILEKFKLPTDYVGVLLHANNILADNKYVKHIDQAGRRWRRKELIAGYFYKALTTAYQEYASSIRHTRKNSKMSIKQSAVIDFILTKDPSTSNLSVNNALNDVECANSVTNKGLVGMNVARGYTIDTRGYDDSMLNVFGMDTGFSGNVGINRQATVNANVEGGRGFIKTIDKDTEKMSTANSFTMTEAVTPFGSTHDDPPRTLMTYVQTSKHTVRCDNNDPMLVTTGADEALPYMTSDIFAYKAKQDGTIVEMVQEGFGKKNYMIIEYKDGSHEFVDLCEEVKQNSDGGYYVPMKLDTDLKVGQKVKAGQVVAYDKLSFSKTLGESHNLAANIGTLAKVAIINTDEGFEDSAAITESFANKLGTYVIQSIETKVEKGSNIFVYKNIGDSVMEGDTLFAYQSDFDDDVANALLKNLTLDAEQLSELGRNPVKSKYTGIVQDIVIYRTCSDEGISSSLMKFIDTYENKIKDTKSVYDKYGIDPSALPKTGKVAEIGKTKNLDDAVLIIYYIKFKDNMSVGDKIVFYSANKGIIKYIIPKEDEPYTDFRKNEHVDSFMSLSSISGRMTCSITLMAATSKLMVELDRSIKELAGIPYDESKL